MTVKQKSLHTVNGFRASVLLCTAVCSLCIDPSLALAQAPARGTDETASTLQLLHVPGLRDRRYQAGIEITMTPHAHTYWKTPGEAGVPPVFAFNGSQNTSAATVSFPVPSRITEEGLDAFGYTGTVVFPVAVTPVDPAKPVVLHADVTYAVCAKICAPAHGEATVTLNPTEAGTVPAPIAAALGDAPTPATAEERASLTVVKRPPADKNGASKPSWTLTWSDAVPVDDIFADAPEGFYFTTKRTGSSSWLLTADQSVGTADGKAVPVSLTLKRTGHSLVVVEKLDVTQPIQ